MNPRIPGPWDSEPNALDWTHAGIACQVRRHESMLHLCGYVCVAPGHPWAGRDYSDVETYDSVDVHGGLTFANGQVFGFDCAHWGDRAPGTEALFMLLGVGTAAPEGVYRDLRYVRLETERLARQARDAAGRRANKRRNRRRREARTCQRKAHDSHQRWTRLGREALWLESRKQ